jgi:hypothetical protein
MKRTALVGFAMLLWAWVLPAAHLFADTFQVGACTGATPLVNNSWTSFNNDAAHLETRANCGAGEITGFSGATSGLAAADVLGLGAQTPEGAVAGWTFTAPAGDTISAISMNRDLFDDGPGWLPQVIDAGGTPLPGETCPYNGNNGGCEISGIATYTGLNTTSLTIEVLCSPASEELTVCGGGSTLHSVRAELDGATVTITDEQPPQITSASGPLFTANLVRGTITGTIDSSDSGSGVQYTRLYVDGALLAQQLSSCDFTLRLPCPTSSSDQFSLNTSNLSPGPHEIQAAVVDAAGNQTLGASDQIVVDNTNPSAPTGVLVDGHSSGTWINQPATITWTNPSQPADDPISQVNWIACPGVETSIPASGCDASHSQSSPLSSLTFDPSQDPTFAGQPQGSYTVFVWLQDAIGNASQANAAAISFGYQTSPPPPPRSIIVSGRGPYTITLTAPAHLAPITQTNWTACDSRDVCTPTESSPGLSFVFAPDHTFPFQRFPYGRYTLRAWLQDSTGNSSPAQAATLTIDHTKSGGTSPELRILSIRRTARALRVRGSAVNALTGQVTIVVRYRLRTRSQTTHTTVRVSRGKWLAVLRLPDGARTTRVTVVRHSSGRWLAQTVTRYIHQDA